jgi:hypothetical protein
MIISLLTSVILAISPPQTKFEIFDQAIYKCKNKASNKIDTKIINDLLEIEETFFKKHNIPVDLKGMLLAASCNESGYNPSARGDWLITQKGKKISKAHGILQLWPWWIKKYNINRDDYKIAATFWLKHIAEQREKIERKKLCSRYLTDKRKWIIAWVRTTRGPSYGKDKNRCKQIPSHYRILQKWIKNIKKERKINNLLNFNGCDC